MTGTFGIIKKKIRIKDIFDGEIAELSYGWKACCPFHAESEPSFKVTASEEGDLWYCHGCKAGGDLFDFVEQYLHMNKRDAYQHVAEMAGIKIEDMAYPTDEIEPIVKQMSKEHSFFKNKGLGKKALNAYGVGYIDSIKKLKVNKKIVVKWKLDDIKDSIFYSIRDRSGLTVGYYYRPIHGGVKYIGNSQLHLFGLHALPRACKYVIIVEGFNDAIKLWSKGIQNVLCACGTNFNEKMFKVLGEHGIRHAIFIPDMDAGGYAWADTIIKKYGTFNTYGVSVGYAMMDHDSEIDPDEYIDANPDFFKDVLKHEKNPIVAYYDSLDCLAWDRVSDIIHTKFYIPAYELQMVLKDKFGGLVDIKPAYSSFYDAKTEKIVLGNMLRDVILKAKMCADLDSEVFVIPEYKQIFNFIKENESVSVDTIVNKFGITINESDIHANSMYVDTLVTLKKKRDIFSILSAHMGAVNSVRLSPEAVVQGVITDFASMIKLDDGMVTADNAVLSTIEDINADRYDGMAIADKFPKLHNLTRGLLKGKLVVIAGNSGEGKTSMALNLVDSISIKQKYKTLFLSGEMDVNELMLRLFSISSGKAYDDIINRKYKLTDKELKGLMNKNLIFDDLPYVEDLYGKIKLAHLKFGGLDTVVLDYLQLIQSKEATGAKRYQILSGMTRRLKKLAREIDVNIIGVAQLSKENLKSEVSKIENLSGAYDMLSDADVGITVKQIVTQNSVTQGNAELNVDKMRYNKSDVLIQIYYNIQNLRMHELNVSL
jgi:replicative DNA helicase